MGDIFNNWGLRVTVAASARCGSILALCLLLNSVNADDLTYTWDEPASPDPANTWYQLQWDSGAGWQVAPSVQANQFTVTTPTLGAGDQITARVRAFLWIDEAESLSSDWSDEHVYIKSLSPPTNVIMIRVEIQ